MDSQYLAYVCDRVQKLTEAVYRVSDMLSDKEPLKWQMRESAVFIFDNTISLKEKRFLEKEAGFRNMIKDIDKILTLFSIFSPSFRIVSGINFEILKEQYLSVKNIIEKELEQSLSDNFLAEIKNIPAMLESGLDSKGTGEISNGQEGIGQGIGQKNNVYNNLSNRNSEKPKKERILNKCKQNSQLSAQRKDKIMDILKDKKEVAVSEIAGLLEGCSEKTAQRELLALAKKGILMAQGEKRWRRYKIASNSL